MIVVYIAFYLLSAICTALIATCVAIALDDSPWTEGWRGLSGPKKILCILAGVFWPLAVVVAYPILVHKAVTALFGRKP